jgi:hypothetical protein
MVRRVDQ